MRKLCWAALGYTAALLLAHYVLPQMWVLWSAGILAVLSLLSLLIRKKALRRRVALSLLAGVAGFGWYGSYVQLFVVPADALVGETYRVQAVALDYASDYGDYASVTVRLDTPGLPSARVLVYDNSRNVTVLHPGDETELELRFTSARVKQGKDTDSYISKGIHVRAYLQDIPSVTGSWRWQVLLLPKKLGKLVKDAVQACYPEDTAGFVTALLTGDKTELYDDTGAYTGLQIAGLSHVVAVSGMHLAFLVGAVRLAVRRRRRTALICAPLILVFMAMTGFTPSVVRAGVMQLILLLAPLLRRENDPPTSLCAALLLILLVNPVAIGSVSLQLSFAAMAGMTLFSEKIFHWVCGGSGKRETFLRRNRLVRGVVNIVCTTISTMVFTVPLTAVHFGYVSLYALPANLLCLWAVSVSFLAGYGVCILWLIWKPLGTYIALAAAWLPRYILAVAGVLAKAPYAALYTQDNYIVWWLVFVYAVFLAAYLLKGTKRLRPTIPVCACVVTLTAVTLLSWQVPEGTLTVSALDVGQGQCIVAMQKNSTVVIDCGGSYDDGNAGNTAAAFLRSKGRRRIDLLVLTHLHADHANGVETLMQLVDVERLALPENADDAGYTDRILSCAETQGTEIYYVNENALAELGNLSLTIYAPLGSLTANERGLMILGSYGDFDFLVTGDADSSTETLLTTFYDLPDLELLVVGHHGSKYSTCTELLDATWPETAFISVGYNSYGHPAESVLRRLAQYRADVYRTDESGTLSLTVER